MHNQNITIMGAGCIGCYLGGRLLDAGYPVTLLGRSTLQQEIKRFGLILKQADSTIHLPTERCHFSTTPTVLKRSNIILFTVKSPDSERAAQILHRHAPPSALVVGFQNGVRNIERLRNWLPRQEVIPGMVSFNVTHAGGGTFLQGSNGYIAIGQKNNREMEIIKPLQRAGLEVQSFADMRPVLWGKLLLNLSNAVNALAGIPLEQELRERAYRKAIAYCMIEALRLLKLAGIKPARTGRILPNLAPLTLLLPNLIFERVASTLLTIDPETHLSMQEDIEQGKKTEIDYLNGEITALAAQLGEQAPVNERIVELVHHAETLGHSPHLSAEIPLQQLAPEAED